MVLLSLLGSGETDHKVEFVEEQAFGSLSFIFFDFPNLLLPAWKPAAAKATGCVSFEILVFSRQKRTLARYSFFFAPHISLLVFLRKCFQVYLSLLPLLDFSYFCIHVIEVVFMEQIRYIFQLFWFFAFSHLVDVTEVLCELELTIKRVKVSTTPDGRVMDLFFITDTRFDILETFSFSARLSASLFVLFSFFF